MNKFALSLIVIPPVVSVVIIWVAFGFNVMALSTGLYGVTWGFTWIGITLMGAKYEDV